MQKIMDCGCDYIRLTQPLGDTQADAFKQEAFNLMEEQNLLGEQFKEAKWLQFKGMKCGPVQWGESDRHAFIQVSGQTAKEAADRFAASSMRVKCCRLDLQTTVDYGKEETDINARYQKAVRDFEALQGTGRRSAFNQFADRDRDTGFTAYARATSRFLRFYHAATGGHREYPVSVYRGEVEYKEEKSPLVWEMYKSAATPGAFAHSMVVAEMMILGLSEPWFQSAIPATLPTVSDKRTDEKTLNWLRTQVMPAVARLTSRGHGGELHAMWTLARTVDSEESALSASLERRQLLSKYFPGREIKNAIRSQDYKVDRRHVVGVEVDECLPHQNGGTGRLRENENLRGRHCGDGKEDSPRQYLLYPCPGIDGDSGGEGNQGNP